MILPLVTAHQPRIVDNGEITQIYNPENSQAFYGQLNGQPAVFKIDESNTFNLYVQLLVPDIKYENVSKDLYVIISNNTDIVGFLQGNTSNWTFFHEGFANDDYWEGPDFNASAKGNYTITVSNNNNTGKYVLVVGNVESFPLYEIIKTVFTLPRLKIYMNKSPLTAYLNLTGIFLLMSLILLAAIILIIIGLAKHKRRHK